ncbi:MAG TPA: BamA/TamA family outer membrane protein [Longimicrobium sp.]|nr:BamA/TamA family outer membrane protein [Longimicrobium sp.]
MRRYLFPLLVALAALPAIARAQDPAGPIPAEVVERITRLVNDTATIQLTGPARITRGSTVTGSVAVLEGSLTLGGRVDGDLAVVNGDLELLEGAAVTGTVTVVGGRVVGRERAAVGGGVTAFDERLDYLRRGGRLYAQGQEPPPADAAEPAAAPGDWSRADDEEDERAATPAEPEDRRRDDDWRRGDEIGLRRRGPHDGRADFVVTTGNGYNRVEGLPITFGPVFETPGSNPFRFRMNGVYRTEAGLALGPGRWGFEARAEQFFGGHRVLRAGATLFRTIDPIEEWHLSKLENGISTFLLHRDIRDHYLREGARLYARVDPRESPVSATLELRLESHKAVEAGSPWALFNNDEPWRPQPLAASGPLHSLALASRLDTRNDVEDPTTGWYVQGEIEQAIKSGLGGSTATPLSTDGTEGLPLTLRSYGIFTRGTVDVRRYNRISPTSRLNFRFLGGGSLDGSPLPPQRQHVLGGEGSLPGYGFFALDCGARDRRLVTSPEDGSPPEFFPAYGCDRFVLGQAEYRGELSFRLDLGLGGGDDDDEWSESDGGTGVSADLGWVLFADVGRAWALDPDFRDEETAADVGFGVLLGRLGVYLAIPVADGGDGVNLFVRLNPRF